MKRLRDLHGDPLIEHAAALLSAVEPPPESAQRMALIRQRLKAHPPAAPRLRAVKPTVWIVAACLVVGGASATTRRWWPPVVAPASDPSVNDPSLPPARHTDPPAPSAASDRSGVGQPTRDESSKQSRSGPRARRRDADRAPNPVGSETVAEAALVYDAVKALRREGDPEKATELLERYANDNPKGALAEEALALRIEAASARRDPAARRWAREYLARYPKGRYREVAQRALSGAW